MLPRLAPTPHTAHSAGRWRERCSGGAAAAELKVLSPETMKPALQELAATFEKESGNKLKIEYAPIEAIQKKVNDEEDYDVVIMDQKATTALTQKAKVV